MTLSTVNVSAKAGAAMASAIAAIVILNIETPKRDSAPPGAEICSGAFGVGQSSRDKYLNYIGDYVAAAMEAGGALQMGGRR
jgi:hypothetical protein